MNKQEIYNTVKTHLLNQMKGAISAEGICQYRAVTPTGTLKCAVGALIPDSEYKPEMEHVAITSLLNPDTSLYSSETKDAIKLLTNLFSKINIFPEAYPLLKDLQNVHDYSSPEIWKTELLCVAKRHNLTP